MRGSWVHCMAAAAATGGGGGGRGGGGGGGARRKKFVIEFASWRARAKYCLMLVSAVVAFAKTVVRFD